VWVGVVAVAIGGFGIFAVAGGYLQTPIGMGNRVTIYGSFTAAFFLAYLAKRFWLGMTLAAVLVFSTLGLSDHWRAWHDVEDRTITALRTDTELTSGHVDTDTLFIVGPSYSHLGPLAHIEFLSDPFLSDPVFALAIGSHKTFKTVPLKSRMIVEADAIVDPKYKLRYPVSDEIAIYDVKAHQLRRMEIKDVPRFIAGLEVPKRHWLQLVEIRWLRDLVVSWMPELAYLWR